MKFDDTYFLYEHIDQGIAQMSARNNVLVSNLRFSILLS